MRVAVASLLFAVASCSFNAGGGGSDGHGSNLPDASGVPGSIVEGSDVPFSGSATGGIVSARNTLEPDVFVPNGLHARGFRSINNLNTSSDPNDTSGLGSSTGEVYGIVPEGNWPQNADTGKGQTQFQPGIGIGPQSDGWSVAYDGEIFLDAGDTVLSIDVDDLAIFEIGVSSPPPRFAVMLQKVQTTVTAPAAGWYPIVGLMAENTLDAHLAFDVVDASGNATPFPASRLRARTTATHGLGFGVFFESELELELGTAYDAGPIDHRVTPLDYPIQNQYSFRYTGQVLIDVAGPHVFAVSVGGDPDDRYRLAIDGSVVTSTWLTEIAGSGSGSGSGSMLAAGWHAIVLDYAQNTGNAEVHLDLDGAAIDGAHLRPTQPQGRAIGATVGPGSNLQAPCTWQNGAAASVCPIEMFEMSPGAIVDYVDAAYVLGGPRNNVTATLSAGATAVALPFHNPANENELGGAGYDVDAHHVEFAGTGDAATWQLSLADTTTNDSGTIQGLVMATIHGGDGAPYAASYQYVSDPYPMPAGAIVVGAKIDGDLAGATTTVEVATADSDSTIGSAAFVPIAADGSSRIAAGKLLVFRVTIADDGWAFAVVDGIAIDYVTPAP